MYRYLKVFSSTFVLIALLLVVFLGAGPSPENSFEKLGLKPGCFFYVIQDDVGIESTGIPLPCKELTQQVLDSFAVKVMCEKRSWYGVDYHNCTMGPSELRVFKKPAECIRNREQYLETEG